MSFLLFALLNTAFIIAISPLFMGMIKKTKAFLQGRQGPSLVQPYFNLLKLFKKETVYSNRASAIMRLTPYVNIAFILVASLSIPLVFIPGPVAGIGNVILFLYLLAMAKFFMALGGLDAGSTFGGMGSSREMTISAIVEPVVIIAFAALALVMKTINLHEMFGMAIGQSLILDPAILLTSVSFFIILIIETSRIPVDNPETHLELTMIHEAMLLEYSGPDLALMEISHAVKQTLLMAIPLSLLAPWGLEAEPGWPGVPLAMLAFLAKGALLAVAVGVTESVFAKFRLFRLPGLFMLAFFFSFSTILFELLSWI